MTEPVSTNRIADLDALRGFALLGILMVNIGAFASAYYGSGLHDPAFDGWLDHLTLSLVRTLFETKFYLLFSFLFGYSFTVQMASAQRAHSAFVPRYLRRSAGLLLLGIGHAVLLFYGDILLTYALLGLLLLKMRQLAPQVAVKLAITLVLVTALCWALVGLAMTSADVVMPMQAIHDDIARATSAYRHGIGATIAQHLYQLRTHVWPTLVLIQAPCALAMFLLGLAAAKTHCFDDLPAQRGKLIRVMLIGAPLGLVGALAYSTMTATPAQIGHSVLGLAIGILTAPALAAAYAAALLLLLQHPRGASLGDWLAPAGRMALTNYLMQSLVCALVFTGWGWGLIGHLAPPSVALLALSIYGVQLLLSRWWLRSHAYGPLEWLLRALTHGRWPAWQSKPPPITPAAPTCGEYR
ncbi:DUF418 domain-containing protein [Rhodoferax sp.]|uniref:DUF418 domain-containing protein n=1 Tax=Rhodoferax sp. TaxID=50421 RepID=UPI002764ACD4|nr:DUF418 domain-containing protein [Rhodoferax sp.]